MVSYANKADGAIKMGLVLILVVMEDGLVLVGATLEVKIDRFDVLILVVMEDGLVHMFILSFLMERNRS